MLVGCLVAACVEGCSGPEPSEVCTTQYIFKVFTLKMLLSDYFVGALGFFATIIFANKFCNELCVIGNHQAFCFIELIPILSVNLSMKGRFRVSFASKKT